MFNEYENDPDDEFGSSFNASMFGDIDELEGRSTFFNAVDGETGGFTRTRMPEGIFSADYKNTAIEFLEEHKAQQDKIIYDIFNGDATGFDSEGFLSKDFSFLFKRIDEVVNGKAALDPEIFARGDMGVYLDVIEDKVATGGDIASGQYSVYSSVSTGINSAPTFELLLEQAGGYVNFSNPDSWADNDPTVISRIKYTSNEEQAFFLKYAAVPGITGSTFDDPVTGYLNDIFNTMALDVYNTVLTREYVPKLIKQERTSISAILSVSIGDESDPLESTIYESTTTFEEEA